MAGCGAQETLRQGARECQWQRVRQLALQGSSVEQRDVAVSQAVTRCQWWLVSQLVLLGVSQRHRDRAVNTAARYCLWDFVEELLAFGHHGEAGRQLPYTAATDRGVWEMVFTALYLGVDRQPLIRVLREMGSEEQWRLAPCLVRQHNSPRVTDFVLQAALGCCQWGCVGQLVRHGLCPTQQRLVCREALKKGYFDCALELLRQGCEQGCAERIVRECFRWNLCQDLIGLLREEGAHPCVRDVILGTAKKYKKWRECMVILGETGVKEKETVDLVTLALRTTSVWVMLRLLSLFVRTRRVFKQVLLRKKFSRKCIIDMHNYIVNKHPVLSFHMLVSQELWSLVLGMFHNPRVGIRERRFALSHAIKKGAWRAVKTMCRKRCALRHCDRRHAFLQAARRGKWRVALAIGKHLGLSAQDQLFALRTWLKCGHWKCLGQVYAEWLEEDFFWDDGDTLLNVVIEESIIADKIEPFRKAISKLDPDQLDSEQIIKTAIKNKKNCYILTLCRRLKSPSVLRTAIELAIENRQWDLVAELLTNSFDYMEKDFDGIDEDFYLNMFLFCLRAVLPEESAWLPIIPALEVFCQILGVYDGPSWEPEETDADTAQSIERLTDWSCDARHANISVVLASMYGTQDRFTRVTEQLGNSAESGVMSFCFLLAVTRRAWQSAAACLENVSLADATIVVCDLNDWAEYSELIEQCRQRQQHRWAVYLGAFLDRWESVEADLEHCDDTEVLDYVVRQASLKDKWDIVQSLIPRCSQDHSLLFPVLQKAVKAGLSDTSTALFPKVSRPEANLPLGSLLRQAVTSTGDREQMLRLCVSFGLSTHPRKCACVSKSECYHHSLIKTTLYKGQLPLFKLVYQSGACSNKQLSRCRKSTTLRAKLQGQNHHDIVQYLDDVATTPRTLQDLCRLRVSHLIGCHAGRQDRIEALDITWIVKTFVRFDDILS